MSICIRRSSFIGLAIAAGTVSALSACGKSSTAPLVAAAVSEISGDSQTVAVGTATANPLVVRVFASTGELMPGVTVSWAVATGSGVLSAASSVTDATGTASVTFTPGTAGTDVVAATVPTLSAPVDFTVIASAPADGTTSSGN